MHILLFIFSSPQEWIVVLVAFSLLFGAKKLPDLAKSIGQARNEFKKGMLEIESENKTEDKPVFVTKTALSQLDDDEIFEEIQRRKTKQLE